MTLLPFRFAFQILKFTCKYYLECMHAIKTAEIGMEAIYFHLKVERRRHKPINYKLVLSLQKLQNEIKI